MAGAASPACPAVSAGVGKASGLPATSGAGVSALLSEPRSPARAACCQCSGGASITGMEIPGPASGARLRVASGDGTAEFGFQSLPPVSGLRISAAGIQTGPESGPSGWSGTGGSPGSARGGLISIGGGGAHITWGAPVRYLQGLSWSEFPLPSGAVSFPVSATVPPGGIPSREPSSSWKLPASEPPSPPAGLPSGSGPSTAKGAGSIKTGKATTGVVTTLPVAVRGPFRRAAIFKQIRAEGRGKILARQWA